MTDAQRLEFAQLVAEYAEAESVRVVVVDGDGVAVAESEALDSFGEDYSNRPEFQAALDGNPATGERESRTLGEDLFYVAVPVLSGEQSIGAVRISAPERVVSDRVSEQVRGLFVVAGLSLLIAIVVAAVVAWTVVQPIRRLRTATGAFAAGDLSTRVDSSGWALGGARAGRLVQPDGDADRGARRAAARVCR